MDISNLSFGIVNFIYAWCYAILMKKKEFYISKMYNFGKSYFKNDSTADMEMDIKMYISNSTKFFSNYMPKS